MMKSTALERSVMNYLGGVVVVRVGDGGGGESSERSSASLMGAQSSP